MRRYFGRTTGGLFSVLPARLTGGRTQQDKLTARRRTKQEIGDVPNLTGLRHYSSFSPRVKAKLILSGKISPTNATPGPAKTPGRVLE
jgi:hypothetical protein